MAVSIIAFKVTVFIIQICWGILSICSTSVRGLLTKIGCFRYPHKKYKMVAGWIKHCVRVRIRAANRSVIHSAASNSFSHSHSYIHSQSFIPQHHRRTVRELSVEFGLDTYWRKVLIWGKLRPSSRNFSSVAKTYYSCSESFLVNSPTYTNGTDMHWLVYTSIDITTNKAYFCSTLLPLFWRWY